MPKRTGESKSARKDAVKWILGYLRPHYKIFIPSILALFFTAGLSMVFPLVLKDLIGEPADAYKNGVDPAKILAKINKDMIFLVCSLSLQAFIGFWRVKGFIRSVEAALNDMRRDIFRHLLNLPLAYFQEHRAGALSNRISSDLSYVRDTMLNTVPQAARQFVVLISSITLIFIFSWKLSLIMLACVPIVVLAVALTGRKVRGHTRAAQDSLAESATVVEESVQGIADVKAFANEKQEIGRYNKALTSFFQTTLKGANARAAFLAFIIFAMFGVIATVVWFGSHMLVRGEISNKEFIAFILFSIFVGASLGSFPEMVSQFQAMSGATERLRELMDTAPEQDGTRPTPALSGELAVTGLSFSYPSRPDTKVLEDLSFEVPAGKHYALVGPSGAGKSTIFSLLLRLNRPDAGKVLFDGIDSSELQLAGLRHQIAVVPQEVMLFGGSIRENIEYGRLGATQQEIEDAAKQANAHDFISSLPEGYETTVGPRGTKLSGGQRQRIAIARAILANPRILLLDEATSALDTESERLVQEALNRLMEGRTTLVIAHRLSTVRHADQILVLSHGKLIESGTHDELIARQGTYKLLVETQLV
jgi:ATP-binding cassette, subfamily B, bacterial